MTDIQTLREIPNLVGHTTAIVAALATGGSVRLDDIPSAIQTVHMALLATFDPAPVMLPEPLAPAVPVRKSITPDHIICLDDGKKYKSLKRHLRGLGMTPDEYREKWGLPADYPMVAPNYSATRSNLAKASGLGRKAA